VEEQRVWVIADLTTSSEPPPNLGDGYRVEARIFVWENDNVLKVPASALFRLGEDWAVFVVEDNEARLRKVEIGKNNGVEAQVLGGLEEGTEVILYPSDRIKDGIGVEVKSAGN
jgi:HlyD family secretion protein